MESTSHFLLDIGILLLGAALGGVISRKLKQPAVLGQIIVGIILGMGIIEKSDLINHIAEIGVVLLMFIAGLETDVKELESSIKSSTVIAAGGVIVPAIIVGGAAYLITNNIISSIFLGVISTATSVGVSVQTLKELGHLKSRQGIGILGAAIIDDIVGIILLTMLISAVQPSTGANPVGVILKIIGFFILAFIVGMIMIKGIRVIEKRRNLRGYILSIGLITCFILAFISEEFGVAAVTGAYFAGVIFSMTSYRHKISHDLQLIGDSFFIPIFFVSIGLGVEFSAIGEALGFSVLLLVLGILTKIVGCGVGAKLSGFNKQHSLQIGVGMIPRAEVAIIIANLGLNMNFINQTDFASVVLLVIGTTLITPSLLKWTFSKEEVKEPEKGFAVLANIK